jgi:hypothetical protein
VTVARRVLTAAALVIAVLVLGPYLVILATGCGLLAAAGLERAGLL